MSLTARDVAQSVYGVYRLARFDATGVEFLNRTASGALASFYAAVIVLPAYVMLLALRMADTPVSAPLPLVLVVESLSYVISWTAYPLVMHSVTLLMGRQDRYFEFLTAYNWSSVVQMSVYLPAALLASSGYLPSGVGPGLLFGVTMAMLTYQWFILRTTLQVNGLYAAMLIMLDLFMSAVIADAAGGMLAVPAT